MLLSMELVNICLVTVLIVALLRYSYSRLCSRHSIPESIQWVSQANSWYSRAQVTLSSFLHTRELVQAGYNKVTPMISYQVIVDIWYQYSKNKIPFVLPNITTGPEVLLPVEQMEWLLQQPDNVLSQNEVNRAFLQADHTMLHPRVVLDQVHEDVIRKELTKLLGDCTNDVQEEIDFAFRKEWGVDDQEWTEITAYDTILNIIARVSNRVLVGFPLCKTPPHFIVHLLIYFRPR
jgi:hypothetical protein